MCDNLCNNSSVPYTSFQIPFFRSYTDDYSTLYVHSQLKIALVQEPVETFNCRLSYKLDTNSNGDHVYTYVLHVYFDNKLHELSKDYTYEVICKQCVRASKGHNHVTVASFVQNRSDDRLVNKGKFVVTAQNGLNHYEDFHCQIRRFNKTDKDVKKGPTVEDIRSSLYKTKSYSCVSFIANGEILQAHKEILAEASEVFREMFSHDMVESKTDIIKIDDLDVKVVEAMLQYIYTGNVGEILKMQKLPELMEVAKRYQIDGLKSLCMDYILINFNYENAVEVLELANINELSELRDRVIDFVSRNEEKMALESSYQEYLMKTLKIDNFAEILILAHKYTLDNVKQEALRFIKEHTTEIANNKDFQSLFEKEPALMKEVFLFIHTDSS